MDGIVGEKLGNRFDIGNLDFCKVNDCVSSASSSFSLLSVCSSDASTWGSDIDRECFGRGGKLAFSSKSVSKFTALTEPSFTSVLADTEELVLVVEGGLGGSPRVPLASWLGERAGEFVQWFELDTAVTAAKESPLSTPRDQGLAFMDLPDDSRDFSETLPSLETASIVERLIREGETSVDIYRLGSDIVVVLPNEGAWLEGGGMVEVGGAVSGAVSYFFFVPCDGETVPCEGRGGESFASLSREGTGDGVEDNRALSGVLKASSISSLAFVMERCVP